MLYFLLAAMVSLISLVEKNCHEGLQASGDCEMVVRETTPMICEEVSLFYSIIISAHGK